MVSDVTPQQIAGMVVFARVVELKSFSRAAEALGLSKSAVSKRIARLEALVGARLLRRTTRSLSVTQAGELLYERAAQALALLSNATGELSSFAEQPRGVLRITAPVTYGRVCLVPLVHQFLARHPQIQLNMVLLDRPVDLAAEGFDFAVRLTPRLPAGVIARPLGRTHYKLVVKRRFFPKNAAPRRPADLVRVNCLRYENTDALSSWQFSCPSGAAKVKVSGNLAMNNSESLRELVLAGLGAAVLPGFLVDPDLRRGRLEEVLSGWRVSPPFATRSHLVWLPDRQLTPKMRALIDYLVAEPHGSFA